MVAGVCHFEKTWYEISEHYLHLIFGVITMTNETLYINGNLCSVVIFALIIRWCVSLHSYSGEKSPPMYGDYEAQRHWMEITVNLPAEKWYFNTSKNDLLYWGLDYPPLTAYHSYINGKIAQIVNPDFVQLITSRGYESYDHKFFMRATVIITDALVYFTSVLLFFSNVYKNSQLNAEVVRSEVPDKNYVKGTNHKFFNVQVPYLLQVAFALLYPGLIMIDHGHFQYNSVSLGLTISGVWALMEDKFVISSILFCSALNYKQMSLYHSLPFFVYILSCCVPNKTEPWSRSFKRLLFVATTVVASFSLIWLPFLKNRDMVLQVLKRLFPLARGIFEDKVSNFWCTLNIFIKLNKTFTQLQMTEMCIFCVFISSFISLVNLFRYPSIKRLILSLINVSLSFFLFSYQVHEKSILLVAVPVLLYFPLDPFPCFWFSIISTFSMLPLFVKDNLILPFISLNVLFCLFVCAGVTFPVFKDLDETPSHKKETCFFKHTVKSILKPAFIISLIGCVILFLCIFLIKPPIKYPDLWPLLISTYSFLHFFAFLIYFNYIQVQLNDFE